MKHSAQDIDRLRRRLGEIYGPDGEAWTPRFAELARPAAKRAA